MRIPLVAPLLALMLAGIAGAQDNPTLQDLADLQVERLRAIEDIQLEGSVFVPVHDPAHTDPGAWRPFRMVLAGERYLVSREVSTFWGIDHEIAVFDGETGWHSDPIHRIIHLDGVRREVFERYDPLSLPQAWMSGRGGRFDLRWLQTTDERWERWADARAVEASHGGAPALRYTFDVGGSGGPASRMTITFASGEEWFPASFATVSSMEVFMGPSGSPETVVSVQGATAVLSTAWFDAGGVRVPLATAVSRHEGNLFGGLGVRVSPESVRINQGVDDSVFAVEPDTRGHLVYDVLQGVYISAPSEEAVHRAMMSDAMGTPGGTRDPRGSGWRTLAVRYGLPAIILLVIAALAFAFRPGDEDL